LAFSGVVEASEVFKRTKERPSFGVIIMENSPIFGITLEWILRDRFLDLQRIRGVIFTLIYP
jgi:hypothetical protein